MDWTIWWDMHRRPSGDRWTEAGAMERAHRFLNLGFVVYEIRDAEGAVFLDEAQTLERFGKTA